MKKSQKIAFQSMMKPLASMLLLFCICLSIIPFSLFHSHEHENELCHPEIPAYEEAACHISAYHSSGLETTACEHGQHIDAAHFFCESCKYFSSGTPSCFILQEHQILPVQFAEPLNSAYKPFLPWNYSKIIFNKGPPLSLI